MPLVMLCLFLCDPSARIHWFDTVSRVYAPVTVPTGSTVQFIWNGKWHVLSLRAATCW